MQQDENVDVSSMDMEVIVDRYFDLPSGNLFPANLLSSRMINSSTSLYEFSFSEYQKDLLQGFDLDQDETEEQQYYKALDAYKTEKITFLISRLANLQAYKNQLLQKADTMESTNPEVGSLHHNLVEAVNGPILTRLTTVEERIAILINGYLYQAFADGDGSEKVRIKDQVLEIETKLSKQNFSKLSIFLTLLGQSKQILQPMMEKESKSQLPNMSEFTSPLSAYCTESDSKRDILEKVYAEMPKSRNIVQARCTQSDSEDSSYFQNAMLKGDIFMTISRDEISVTLGEKERQFLGVKGLQSACIAVEDGTSNNSLIVSNSLGLISTYKLVEGDRNIFKFQSNFQTPMTEIEYQLYEKGKLYCLEPSQFMMYICDTETKEINEIECKASEPFYPGKMSFNKFNDKLYTTYHALLHELDINTGRSNYLVGAGNSFTDLDFDKNLILASSSDFNLHLFDTRLQFYPILRLLGHGDFVEACTFANVEGNLFAFSGGRDECIRCWDLRMQLPLYELSTGNNKVKTLDWQDSTCSLISCTNYLAEGNSPNSKVPWQVDAHHVPTHFKKHYNLDQGAIIKYSFQ